MEDINRISVCRQIRYKLDQCLDSSQLLSKDCKQVLKHFQDFCYLNAAKNDSRNFVFGLNPRQDGLPKMKVK